MIEKMIEALTDNAIAVFMVGATAYWITEGLNVPDVWYGFLGAVITYYFTKP